MKQFFLKGGWLIAIILFMGSTSPRSKRIIFFGDSITQAGVQGDGYIKLLKTEYDQNQFEFHGAGIGGNKVYDLYLRLDKDVLAKDPDLVFVYIGINDVWHKVLTKTGTDYNKFLGFYEAIIVKLKTKGSQVVLCTPTVIGEKPHGLNDLDTELDKYAQGVRYLAQKYHLPLCDLRAAFMNYLEKNNTEHLEQGILTTDKVHLNAAGNRLVADTMKPFLK